MTKRCFYRHPNGAPCRRWASRDSEFCFYHQPDHSQQERHEAEHLHPLMRLASPEDIFDVVRETLNAVRLGRIRPGRAYAVGYLVDVWLRVRKELKWQQRDAALCRQLLTEQVEVEELADEALDDEVSPLPDTAHAGSQADDSAPGSPEPAGSGLDAVLKKAARKAALALVRKAGKIAAEGLPQEDANPAKEDSG